MPSKLLTRILSAAELREALEHEHDLQDLHHEDYLDRLDKLEKEYSDECVA